MRFSGQESLTGQFKHVCSNCQPPIDLGPLTNQPMSLPPLHSGAPPSPP